MYSLQFDLIPFKVKNDWQHAAFAAAAPAACAAGAAPGASAMPPLLPSPLLVLRLRLPLPLPLSSLQPPQMPPFPHLPACPHFLPLPAQHKEALEASLAQLRSENERNQRDVESIQERERIMQEVRASMRCAQQHSWRCFDGWKTGIDTQKKRGFVAVLQQWLCEWTERIRKEVRATFGCCSCTNGCMDAWTSVKPRSAPAPIVPAPDGCHLEPATRCPGSSSCRWMQAVALRSPRLLFPPLPARQVALAKKKVPWQEYEETRNMWQEDKAVGGWTQLCVCWVGRQGPVLGASGAYVPALGQHLF